MFQNTTERASPEYIKKEEEEGEEEEEEEEGEGEGGRAAGKRGTETKTLEGEKETGGGGGKEGPNQAQSLELVTKLTDDVKELLELVLKLDNDDVDLSRLKPLGDSIVSGIRVVLKNHPNSKKFRKKEEENRKCNTCGTDSTPEWRRGPAGPRTLCNACGLKLKKKTSGGGKIEKKRSSTITSTTTTTTTLSSTSSSTSATTSEGGGRPGWNNPFQSFTYHPPAAPPIKNHQPDLESTPKKAPATNLTYHNYMGPESFSPKMLPPKSTGLPPQSYINKRRRGQLHRNQQDMSTPSNCYNIYPPQNGPCSIEQHQQQQLHQQQQQQHLHQQFVHFPLHVNDQNNLGYEYDSVEDYSPWSYMYQS